MSRFFSKSIKSLLYIRQDGHCAICGTELKGEFHADHIHPYSKGGRTTIENCQLLCPKCNLSKGDKVMSEEQEINLELREWQEEAIEIFKQAYTNKEKLTFLVTAFPGAGKTKFTIACMLEVLKLENSNAIFLVFSPKLDVQKNWADTAFEFTNGNIDISTDIHIFSNNDFDGLSETYQTIPFNVDLLVNIINSKKYKGYKVIAIFDEIHHLSNKNSWGYNAYRALNQVDFFICLSGTPFRSDNNRITLLEYDKTGRVIPDYNYSYARAIRDRVCRSIIFNNQDGELTYQYLNENIKFNINDFDDDDEVLNYSNVMGLIGHADINNPSKPLTDMILKCSDNLEKKRNTEQVDAAAIVFCIDIKHAKSVKKLIEKLTDDEVEMVTSDDSKSLEKIKEFKNSELKWIVSIAMISEGVDIPRARNIIWLSEIKTYSNFVQAIGRVIRFQPNIEGNQYADVYLPDIPILQYYAKRIMEEYMQESGEEEWPPPPPPPPPPPSICEVCGQRPCVCEKEDVVKYVDSLSGEISYVYRGTHYTQAETDQYLKNIKTRFLGLSNLAEDIGIETFFNLVDYIKEEISQKEEKPKESAPVKKEILLKQIKQECINKRNKIYARLNPNEFRNDNLRAIVNSKLNEEYFDYCKENNIESHWVTIEALKKDKQWTNQSYKYYQNYDHFLDFKLKKINNGRMG